MTTESIHEILANRELKTKAKAEALAGMLVAGDLDLDELMAAARDAKGPDRATCIEAIEFATKAKPELATLDGLRFVTGTLSDKAPRAKWESARVIANIAHLYPEELELPICELLENTEHPGTVVRWSAALALGEILKLKTNHHTDLTPAIEAILRREQDNAIKKIYQAALKKIGR
jgi:hypothetical protein